MGLILDSSILIAAERGGESVRQILKRVQAEQGETETALSAITIVELTHGIYRARTDEDRERRRAFTEELCRAVVVHPVNTRNCPACRQDRGRGGDTRCEHSLRGPLDRRHGVAPRLCSGYAQCPPLPADSWSFGSANLTEILLCGSFSPSHAARCFLV